MRQFAEQQVESAHIAAGVACRLRESEELARVVREHAVEAVRGRFTQVLEQAVARGELPAGHTASPLFADVAPALIHTRVLLSLEPVDDAFAEALVDQTETDEHLGCSSTPGRAQALTRPGARPRGRCRRPPDP